MTDVPRMHGKGARVETDLAGVFARERSGLVRLASFLLADPRSAEDVCQEVAAALVHTAGDHIDNPAAYLRTAIVHRCARENKHASSRASAEGRFSRWRRRVDDIDEGALHDDAFFRRLRRLSSAQRAVVVLVYYEDLTLAAAAEQLGLPVGTAKSHLNRALDKLRSTLP